MILRPPRSTRTSTRCPYTTLFPSLMTVHQAFLPKGFLGALEAKPFTLDVDKAKKLLAEAGYPNGFKITMDTRSVRSEEHTSELQSLMRISYAVYCLKNKT